ncbi:hypothetical protein MA20_07720 [Bradyrhizobium japonicum]|uniref:Uncharacterized protein n=1 Tax=Bradyrhizobium japonicum TaxID=375 RepID=A0A0A3Z3L9_BRAJP|nr:hypothetical protein [Bradyrhizobium japonicum]KGT80468.1 hypothetical protein MA20_07720 [Bradyrhizobium japonicum]
MVKKAKKPAKKGKPTKRAVKAKPRSRSKPMTKRETAISAKLAALGKSMEANETLLALNLEIDRTFGGGAIPKFGEVTGRMALANKAFGDAILASDDFDTWVAAARSAAGLA